MAKKNRAKLKNYFLKGNIPTEEQFHDLIDSSLNQEDDGILKENGEALKLRAEGANEEMLAFFRNMEDKFPTWKISNTSKEGDIGMTFQNAENSTILFLQDQGNVGVGTSKPAHKLDVDGIIGMKGRTGTFASGEVPADGEWHTVISGLNELNAFEIVGKVSEKGAHSVLYAIALSAYGKSKNKIVKHQGYFGRCRNCIDVRFDGSYFDYSIQIRTKRKYKEETNISYTISKLV